MEDMRRTGKAFRAERNSKFAKEQGERTKKQAVETLNKNKLGIFLLVSIDVDGVSSISTISNPYTLSLTKKCVADIEEELIKQFGEIAMENADKELGGGK